MEHTGFEPVKRNPVSLLKNNVFPLVFGYSAFDFSLTIGYLWVTLGNCL